MFNYCTSCAGGVHMFPRIFLEFSCVTNVLRRNIVVLFVGLFVSGGDGQDERNIARRFYPDRQGLRREVSRRMAGGNVLSYVVVVVVVGAALVVVVGGGCVVVADVDVAIPVAVAAVVWLLFLLLLLLLLFIDVVGDGGGRGGSFLSCSALYACCDNVRGEAKCQPFRFVLLFVPRCVLRFVLRFVLRCVLRPCFLRLVPRDFYVHTALVLCECYNVCIFTGAIPPLVQPYPLPRLRYPHATPTCPCRERRMCVAQQEVPVSCFCYDYSPEDVAFRW